MPDKISELVQVIIKHVEVGVWRHHGKSSTECSKNINSTCVEYRLGRRYRVNVIVQLNY